MERSKGEGEEGEETKVAGPEEEQGSEDSGHSSLGVGPHSSLRVGPSDVFY